MYNYNENTESQKFGIIICQKCEKEVETFHSEKVVTQYGICEHCKDSSE
ncbi:GapA-binding peptide SR1P [Oceanobacillus jeddahense]|uniref:GapA-binding peptide SR1P n=1 Tax=Oceanobacillus jeddahense TaxID=1462527 RepID=A0ABY5JXQ2_9BACI|nr:GapA-binding peptide SR1P [Oceanobacillus jeddahense]UUI05163.1 GapA-binding peptide SR1P [Oceanobacillus jeddahense]